MSKFHSKFAADADWQELLSEFIQEMPLRVAALQAAVRAEDGTKLMTLVHQLRGACGSYGFDAITPLATELEIALRAGSSISNLTGPIDGFVTALASLTDQRLATTTL